MPKCLRIAALLGLAACGGKSGQAPADDSAAATAPAAAAADTAAKVAGDTAKTP